MKVTKEDACVILPHHELADSYPRLQSALPRVELMKTRSPRVYSICLSRDQTHLRQGADWEPAAENGVEGWEPRRLARTRMSGCDADALGSRRAIFCHGSRRAVACRCRGCDHCASQHVGWSLARPRPHADKPPHVLHTLVTRPGRGSLLYKAHVNRNTSRPVSTTGDRQCTHRTHCADYQALLRIGSETERCIFRKI